MDKIAFSKTWLTEDISSAELGLNNYSIFRCDRSPNTSQFSIGGGVLIAVKKNFATQLIKISVNNIEHIFVRIIINNIKIIVGCAYISPNSKNDTYNSHLEVIEILMLKYSNYKYIIFLGDYIIL